MENIEQTDKATKGWDDTKKKILTKWNKLSEDDLPRSGGDLSSLSARLADLYGMTKDNAEKELNEFKKTLGATSNPASGGEKAASPATSPMTSGAGPETKKSA